MMAMLNFLVILVLSLGSGFAYYLRPDDKRWRFLSLTFVCAFVVTFWDSFCLIKFKVCIPLKYDLYAYYLDQRMFWGNSNFYLGQFLNYHPVIKTVTTYVYFGFLFPLWAIIFLYALKIGDEAPKVVFTVLLNLLLAIPLYAICPVAGPKYVFPEFPDKIPVPMAPHALFISAFPNGVPSVHTSTALLVLFFLSRWRSAKIFGIIWLGFTILGTLGFGEHYLIDLLLAVPYSLAVIYLGGFEIVRQQRNLTTGELADERRVPKKTVF